MTCQRMTTLVIRNGATLFFGNDATAALGASNNALHGLFDLGLTNLFFVIARRKQRGLVHKIGEVSAREARGKFCQALKINARGKGFTRSVHLKDLLTATYVRTVHRNTTVKTARAQ